MNLKRFFLKNKMFLVILLFFIILTYVTTLVFYKGINRVYFQQDEWHAIGKSIYYLYANPLDLLIKKRGNHYIPLTSIFYIFEYLLFGLKANLYLYSGIFFQSIAAFTFYLLSKRLFKMKFLPFLISFLFLINPGSYQVILNSSTTYYILSVIVSNITFIITYDFISKYRDLSCKKILILILLFFINIFIYEVGITLLILVPIFIYFFHGNKFHFSFEKNKLQLIFGVFTLLVCLFFLQLKVIKPDLASIKVENFKTITIYNTLSTPFKFIANNLLGEDNIFSLGRVYAQKISSFRTDPLMNLELFSITAAYDIVVMYFSIFVLVFVAILSYLNKNSERNKRICNVILFSFIWLVLLGVIISPQGRVFNSLESRYLYLSSNGALLIFGSILALVWGKFNASLLGRSSIILAVFIYVFFWSLYSYGYIQKITKRVVDVSIVRKSVLEQITNKYPTLPKKTAIYIYCKNYICGGNSKFEMLPSWVVPFQSGFGWSLLTVYSGVSPKKYAPFFSEYFLWDPLSNNYKEINGIGFGYFIHPDLFKHAINKYKLKKKETIIVEYDSFKYKIK